MLVFDEKSNFYLVSNAFHTYLTSFDLGGLRLVTESLGTKYRFLASTIESVHVEYVLVKSHVEVVISPFKGGKSFRSWHILVGTWDKLVFLSFDRDVTITKRNEFKVD